jgi:RHS repeat-associated protein
VGLSGDASASFQYDGLGRRRGKTINGTSTNFLYDVVNLVQELTGGGTPTANLLTGLGVDETFARTDGSGTSTLLVDALGSTLELADGSGTAQTLYTFEPFGASGVSGAASTNAAQFTSRESDSTGLYYYRARFYHPGLQRFISEDPLGFGGGLNLFAYVGNRPTAFIDPLGLKPKPCFFCFGSSGGAGSGGGWGGGGGTGAGRGGNGGGGGGAGNGGANGDSGAGDSRQNHSSRCSDQANADYNMTKQALDPFDLVKGALLSGLRADETVAASVNGVTLTEALLGSSEPISIFTATVPTISIGSIAVGAAVTVGTVYLTDVAFNAGLRVGSYISAWAEGACQ